MSESLLRAVKLFVVVGGVLIIVGTATLIALLVKRGTGGADAGPPKAALAATVELPPGGEILAVDGDGRDLLLLGRAPQGQFLLLVDRATGARGRLFWLTPAAP